MIDNIIKLILESFYFNDSLYFKHCSGTKIIKVKSLKPSFDIYKRPGITEYSIAWPTLLIDTPGGQRETMTPIWVIWFK